MGTVGALILLVIAAAAGLFLGAAFGDTQKIRCECTGFFTYNAHHSGGWRKKSA